MRSSQLALLIGLGLMVSACGTENRGMESVHQPVVSRTDYVLDVGASQGGLSSSDLNRLASWFDSLKVGYGDKISIDMPGGGNGLIRSQVSSLAARYGLLVNNAAPVTSGQIYPGDARVIVSRTKAEVPGCPDWSRASDDTHNADMHSNYGCATNKNLAAMIANPEDLILGHNNGDTRVSMKSNAAIGTYQKGPVK